MVILLIMHDIILHGVAFFLSYTFKTDLFIVLFDRLPYFVEDINVTSLFKFFYI